MWTDENRVFVYDDIIHHTARLSQFPGVEFDKKNFQVKKDKDKFVVVCLHSSLALTAKNCTRKCAACAKSLFPDQSPSQHEFG